MPREYEVSLLAETLPEHGQLTSVPAIKVSLTPGSQIRALVFAIHRPERPIIFK